VDERSLRSRMESFLSGGPGLAPSPAVRRILRAVVPAGVEGASRGRRPKPTRGPRDRFAESSYDEVFRRVEVNLRGAREQVAREHVQACGLWERLRPHPQSRRLMMVQNDRRLHAWGLFDFLLERSRALSEVQTQLAAELAHLALAIVERLPADTYGAERLEDFRCAVWTELANALRLSGNLAGARQALAEAKSHLDLGTGDLLDRANLVHRLFELLRDQGDLEDAFAALEHARTLYGRMGDDRLRGIALLPYPQRRPGDPASVDPEEDPREAGSPVA